MCLKPWKSVGGFAPPASAPVASAAAAVQPSRKVESLIDAASIDLGIPGWRESALRPRHYGLRSLSVPMRFCDGDRDKFNMRRKLSPLSHVRHDRGGFDLDQRFVFDQRGDLDDRHGGKVPPHHAAID